MANYLGDFAASATVRLWWNTNAIAGESITRATDGSIRIYKDGSDTQRSSSAGITDSEDTDSLTGVHRLSIDLSDNTDAGFYAAGSDYAVVLVAATIDGKTVNHALGQFSIENRNIKANLTQWLGVAPLALTSQKVNSTLDSTERTSIADTVWNRLTSALTTAGSIGKYLLDKLAPVSAGSITYTNPVNPSTQNLKLYDQDYSEESGIILPSWDVADWGAFGLSTATDLTLTYQETDGPETPFGELEAVSDTKIQLQIAKADVKALPYGENAAGIIIRATLDADHGEDTVQLVNAALSHYNYVKVPGKP